MQRQDSSEVSLVLQAIHKVKAYNTPVLCKRFEQYSISSLLPNFDAREMENKEIQSIGGVQPSTSTINILVIVVAGLGSYNFGYANNAIAGSFAQVSFGIKFLSGSNANSIIGAILGVFYGGGLIGAIIQAPISDHYGRRAGSVAGGMLMVISGALQSGATHIAMFLVGRFIGGIASGILIANCPVYMSEISPPHNRGKLVSIHAIGLVFGYVVAAVFALVFYFVDGSYQWRLQFVLLTFFALCLVVSVHFLPESPRWLVEKGNHDAAWKVLERIHRSKQDPEAKMAHAEMIQIRTHVELERSLPKGYVHIFRTPSLRKRAILSILVWCIGQGSGVLVIANLTPLLFKALGYSVVEQLGLSIAWVAVATVCIIGASFFIDTVGRVKLIVAGGYLMAVSLAIEAALQKNYLNSNNKPALNAAVAFFFVFITFYGLFFDGAAFTYGAEIWPTHLRSQGASITLVSFFANTIAYTAPASKAFATIGWKYYMVFIVVATVMTTIFAFIAPETSKLTLEDIGAKFGDSFERISANSQLPAETKTIDEGSEAHHLE
ncbi:hypothetical protein LTR84_010757 [Exophiala bonariae]|uniref:Major facilitator superfamily (MFS) profile domain-containing protein n=1 Tax=Exophiala bonariae TaxID=1690606 RepID=A0AAV9MSA1_9EURO|nr:hypothetical protein LTR84_010757 [Exophiala bonariae]